jgi:hypothetical protein
MGCSVLNTDPPLRLADSPLLDEFRGARGNNLNEVSGYGE